MHNFPAAGPVAVSLNVLAGTVAITAGDGDEVTVQVSPSSPARSSDVRSADQTRVEFSGERLTIVQPRPLSHYAWFGGTNSIDITVHVPRGSRIDADSSYGSIRVDGAIGPSKIKTSYGDVDVEEGEDLILRTGYGDITVGRATGHTDAVGGKVRIAEVDGSATVKSSQDGTFIGIAAGPIHVTSSYGDIEIDHALAPVVATTAYGKVRINDAVRGSIEMRSSYGGLELGIRQGTAAWLDLDAHHGSLRNALENASAPPGTDGSEEQPDTVEVLGRTAWGNITVRRAATP